MSELAIRTDVTAPSGDGVVLGIEFTTAHSDANNGFEPINLIEWDQCTDAAQLDYRQMYNHFRFKLAGGPNGDLTTWEFVNGVTKVLGFWGPCP